MKLTCEVCGGPILIIAGGKLAVCKDCGTEYTMARMKELAAAAGQDATPSGQKPDLSDDQEFRTDRSMSRDSTVYADMGFEEEPYYGKQAPLGRGSDSADFGSQAPLGRNNDSQGYGSQAPLGRSDNGKPYVSRDPFGEEVQPPRDPGKKDGKDQKTPKPKKKSGAALAGVVAVAVFAAIGSMQNEKVHQQEQTLPKIEMPEFEEVFVPVSSSSREERIRQAVQDAAAYTVVVNGGEGSGEYKEGDTVWIYAQRPSEDQRFAHWDVEGPEINLEIRQSITSFTMPAGNVTISAAFTYDIPVDELYTDDEIRAMADNVWGVHLEEEGFEKQNDFYFFESNDRSQAGFCYYASGETGIKWNWNEYLTSIEPSEENIIADTLGMDPDTVSTEIYNWENGSDVKYIGHVDDGSLIVMYPESGEYFVLLPDTTENYVGMHRIGVKWYAFEHGE